MCSGFLLSYVVWFQSDIEKIMCDFMCDYKFLYMDFFSAIKYLMVFSILVLILDDYQFLLPIIYAKYLPVKIFA
jgi:hypothetical protein